MQPIPFPSHIHYESLLQILERQTIVMASQGVYQEQVHELIATLRKALTQQKNLEERMRQADLPLEYRWSLTERESPVVAPEVL